MGTVFNALEKSNKIEKDDKIFGDQQIINQITEIKKKDELNKPQNSQQKESNLSFVEKHKLFSHIFDPFDSQIGHQRFPEEYQKKI